MEAIVRCTFQTREALSGMYSCRLPLCNRVRHRDIQKFCNDRRSHKHVSHLGEIHSNITVSEALLY